MTGSLLRLPTPRSAPTGASARPAARVVLLALALLAGAAAPAVAQARGDTIPLPDSVVIPDTVPRPDTLFLSDTSRVLVVPDTAVTRPGGEADTSSAAPFHRVPEMVGGTPAGPATGVWVFEREDILGSRALTLAELVSTLPGVLPLRGGDFGTPRTVTAYALGGGGVRVLWDGVEIVPLDGGAVDLGQVGLGGVERVRIVRDPAELRIEITSLRNFDPRPYTLVEAGTGDLNTNVFRGTFVHPHALGGSLGVSLDRLDTRGPRGEESGSLVGAWLRYTWHGGDRWAVTGELRRMKAENDVTLFPSSSTRADWVLRARGRLAPGLVAEAYAVRSSLRDELTDTTWSRDGSQYGLQASWDPGAFWTRGALRLFGGDVPSSSVDLSAGASLPRGGGADAALSRDVWQGDAATLVRLQAWTPPLLGLSAFASWSSGKRGARRDTLAVPPADTGEGTVPAPLPVEPFSRLTDRTAVRLGAVWRWKDATVSGARVTLDTDSLRPLGTPLDRDGLVLPGVKRTGWEVTASLPLPLLPEGFAFDGSYQQWDEGARYLPRRQYQAAVDFHDTFLATHNLEVWSALGVDGRDPMTVPLLAAEQPSDPEAPRALAAVPFYQSWYGYLQIRVVTVRVFIRWQNFTLRDANQDFPDRVLPRSRTLYGVRWTLWN